MRGTGGNRLGPLLPRNPNEGHRGNVLSPLLFRSANEGTEGDWEGTPLFLYAADPCCDGPACPCIMLNQAF